MRLALLQRTHPTTHVKLLLQVAGIIGGEVVTVVLHSIGIDSPDLILPFLHTEYLGSIVLHKFSSILQELDLHFGDGLYFLIMMQLACGGVVLE